MKLDRAKGVRPGIVDALEEQLLRELASGGQLTAEDLAYRVHARQWVDLSTALAQLTARGHVTVVVRSEAPRHRIVPTLKDLLR